MTDELIKSIQRKLSSSGHELLQPASIEAITAAEEEIGFKLPELLRECLARVANGGFGPGYGLVGVGDGYQSDFGNLSNTFQQLRDDKESEGDEWPERMLPFCEWGNAIFSCVNCDTMDVWTFKDFELEQTEFNISEFFERWLNGRTAELIESSSPRRTATIRNPFTGDDTEVSGA